MDYHGSCDSPYDLEVKVRGLNYNAFLDDNSGSISVFRFHTHQSASPLI